MLSGNLRENVMKVARYISQKETQNKCQKFSKQLPESVLKILGKFIGTVRHACWSQFFNKVADFKPATVLKRGYGACIFLLILKIFKNTYFKEYLWTAASEN